MILSEQKGHQKLAQQPFSAASFLRSRLHEGLELLTEGAKTTCICASTACRLLRWRRKAQESGLRSCTPKRHWKNPTFH